jgi:hypothetical protein
LKEGSSHKNTMKINVLMHTVLFFMMAAAFMVASSHAQGAADETDGDEDEDFDAFCSSQVKSNNCYAPQCIVSCGDKVNCNDDCSGGVSDVCFDDGGMKICTPAVVNENEGAGGENVVVWWATNVSRIRDYFLPRQWTV